MSEDAIDDFFEYTRGKKIPPEGIPGFDFSDPESIVEFTKYAYLSTLSSVVILYYVLPLLCVIGAQKCSVVERQMETREIFPVLIK